jgi:hypothetical protein
VAPVCIAGAVLFFGDSASPNGRRGRRVKRRAELGKEKREHCVC